MGLFPEPRTLLIAVYMAEPAGTSPASSPEVVASNMTALPAAPAGPVGPTVPVAP